MVGGDFQINEANVNQTLDKLSNWCSVWLLTATVQCNKNACTVYMNVYIKPSGMQQSSCFCPHSDT